MIPTLFIENGFSPKHPFINGCLGFQAVTKHHQNIPVDSMTPFADLYLFLWSLSPPSRFSFQTGVTCVAGTHVHFLGINLWVSAGRTRGYVQTSIKNWHIEKWYETCIYIWMLPTTHCNSGPPSGFSFSWWGISLKKSSLSTGILVEVSHPNGYLRFA